MSWISIEDKLPDMSHVVLIWAVKAGKGIVATGFYYGNHKWCDPTTTLPFNINPTHWMELPEPPN